MKIFFRVLLAIYAFCLAVFSAFAMYVAVFPMLCGDLGEYNPAISTDNAMALRIAVFAVALVFRSEHMFLLSGVRNNRIERP